MGMGTGSPDVVVVVLGRLEVSRQTLRALSLVWDPPAFGRGVQPLVSRYCFLNQFCPLGRPLLPGWPAVAHVGHGGDFASLGA